MPSFSPENDFFVFDLKAPLTWHRPGGYATIQIPGALRLADVQSLASETTSVEKNEAVWIFSKGSLPDEAPIPGDLLVDAQKVRWTISEVQNLQRRGSWKCSVVNLMRHFDLRDLLDVYRPLWTLDENGAPFPEYRLSRPGIPGKILKSGTNSQIEIQFAEPELNLAYRDCLMTPSNQAFRVLEFHPAANWQEVSRAICVEVTL